MVLPLPEMMHACASSFRSARAGLVVLDNIECLAFSVFTMHTDDKIVHGAEPRVVHVEE